ncbi:MAG: pyridoxal phosphate-dependent aminotransferase [Alphaproteobacteria bacterium]
MHVTEVVQNLSTLGGAKWDVHIAARRMQAEGRQILEMTIGEPDQPMSPEIAPAIADALARGRTSYSNGRGEPALLRALAERYSQRRGRPFSPQQFLCFPGTQTALYALMRGLVQSGDEVILFDPCYATYEGVVVSSGATIVSVPLNAAGGFCLDVPALKAAITPRTRAILVNAPQNPTGAVLSHDEALVLGEIARENDLWLVCDEVYEDLIFDGYSSVSPLMFEQFSDRCFACASISKSNAAPGLRSGWAVGPEAIIDQLLPLAETMLFGNQPFIADATAEALKSDGATANSMRASYQQRANRVLSLLDGKAGLRVNPPKSGMFALVDVAATGLDGYDFAMKLLTEAGVAVMPGTSFGEVTRNWIRLSLTVPDERIDEACRRIVAFAAALGD